MPQAAFFGCMVARRHQVIVFVGCRALKYLVMYDYGDGILSGPFFVRNFLIQYIYVYESISIQIYIYTNMFPSLSLHISSLPIPLQSCILTSRPRCIRLGRVWGTTAIRQVAHAAHTQEPSPPKTR